MNDIIAIIFITLEGLLFFAVSASFCLFLKTVEMSKKVQHEDNLDTSSFKDIAKNMQHFDVPYGNSSIRLYSENFDGNHVKTAILFMTDAYSIHSYIKQYSEQGYSVILYPDLSFNEVKTSKIMKTIYDYALENSSPSEILVHCDESFSVSALAFRFADAFKCRTVIKIENMKLSSFIFLKCRLKVFLSDNIFNRFLQISIVYFTGVFYFIRKRSWYPEIMISEKNIETESSEKILVFCNEKNEKSLKEFLE